MKIILIMLALFYVSVGCKTRSSDKAFFKNIIKREKRLCYSSISPDAVKLDAIETSYSGYLSINNGYLYFVDNSLCWVFKFNTDGRFLNRYIGQGDGPNELPIKYIQFYSPTADGGFFFIGSSWDCFQFDSGFHRVNDYEMRWHTNGTIQEAIKHPDTTMMDGYSLGYFVSQIRITKDEVFLPLMSSHPLFNPTMEAYSKNARILAIMNMENGYVYKTIGRLSPIFNQNKDVRTFSYISFDILSDNKMIVCYPPDSLLYVVDGSFNSTETFGFEGRDMLKEYNSVTDIYQFAKNWQLETKLKGYYHSVRYIPERGLLFRSYQKGGKEITDGLQIYKMDTLVGDVDVPKGFKVEGFIAPYFYSNAFIDEVKGEIVVYRFKLD